MNNVLLNKLVKQFFFFIKNKNVRCIFFGLSLLRPKPKTMFWAIFCRTFSVAEYSVHPYFLVQLVTVSTPPSASWLLKGTCKFLPVSRGPLLQEPRVSRTNKLLYGITDPQTWNRLETQIAKGMLHSSWISQL